MSEGWSLDRELIPSDGETMHPDMRMHWYLGDMPLNATKRVFDVIAFALPKGVCSDIEESIAVQ